MSEPKPMDPADLDDLRREVECGNLGEAIGELLDAHDFWRAVAKRGPVSVNVVEAFGVTPDKRDAWLRSRPDMESVRDTESPDVDWYRRGLYICSTRPRDKRETVETINAAAAEFGLGWWEVAEQMAAMEVSGG